jgi:hypothetical protein
MTQCIREKYTKKEKNSRSAIKLKLSLIKKYGKKLILSFADEIPSGLLEPS